MANFPNLNANRAYAALYNAYRLMSAVGDNLSGLDMSNANKYKIQGGEYEDQLVWTYSDVLKTRAFDPEDISGGSMNVLAPGQRATVSQQAMDVNKIRQIDLYIPANFLTKQAWMKASFFDGFMSVVEAQMGETRKLFDQRTVDVYIGTTETAVGLQTQTVALDGANDALDIATKLADIMDDLSTSTRDYNDKGYMIATPEKAVDIYINSTIFNTITKKDLPTVFHKDGLFARLLPLNHRYIGHMATASDVGSGKAIGSDGKPAAANTVRAAVEIELADGTNLYPGDAIPTTTVVYANGAFTIPCYVEDASIIAKIIHSDAIKYISAIETDSEFFNAKNLSRNKYLTFMYGGPDRLAIRPFVTLKKA